MQNNAVNLYDYQKTTVRDLPEILEQPFQMKIEAISYDAKEMLFSIDDQFFRINVPKTPSWNVITTGSIIIAEKEKYQGTGQNAHITYGKLHLRSVLMDEPKVEYENVNAAPFDADEPPFEQDKPLETEIVPQANLSVLLEEAILSLNDGQRAAFDMITAQESNFFFITGSPGVGKSFLAKVIKLHFQKQNKLVTAIAPSHKAKKVLSEAMDLYATTVARFCGYTMGDTDDPAVNDEGDFIKIRDAEETYVAVVDECSMVSEDQFQEIRDASQIVIALGDKNQLTAINDTPADMGEAITFELTEQMRQEDTDTALYYNIQLVKDRLNGNPRYGEQFKFDDTFIAVDNLIDTYIDKKIEIIISYRNVFIDAYNDEIQKRVHGDSAIRVDDDLILNKPVNAMTPTQVGARQIFPIIQNNGDIIKVTHIHDTQPEVGTIVDLDFGDPADRTRLLLSREQWATRSFVWELWLDKWKPIMQWKQFKRFAINASLPYAVTCHKAQGSTYDNVGVNLSDIAGAWKQDDMYRMQYVAMSRAKYKCYVKV